MHQTAGRLHDPSLMDWLDPLPREGREARPLNVLLVMQILQNEDSQAEISAYLHRTQELSEQPWKVVYPGDS